MHWVSAFLNMEFGYDITFGFDVLFIANQLNSIWDLNFCLNFLIYVVFLDYYRKEIKNIGKQCFRRVGRKSLLKE